jgi:hypothetical protein
MDQREAFTMLRHFMSCIIAVAAVSAAAQAGDHYYFPGYAFAAPPVVYAAPVVSYQPAYVVPSMSVVSVHSYPVSTVGYSTSYYAPMVPTVAVAPSPFAAYYGAPAVVAPAAYAVPGYYRRHGHFRRYRGVEVEIERDGDIEIDYR